MGTQLPSFLWACRATPRWGSGTSSEALASSFPPSLLPREFLTQS